MAIVHALLIVLALFVLASLPCVVIFVLFADSFLNPISGRARRPARGESQARATSEVPAQPTGPPLEQIAADLHRLGSARLSCVLGSTRYNATTRAYDHRLMHACRALEVDEHLSEVEGVDLDLERLRVEGQLIESGFVLTPDGSRSA